MSERRHVPDRRRLLIRLGGSGRRSSDELPQHGTRARYRKGCRCVPCRAASAQARAELRKRILLALPRLGQRVPAGPTSRLIRLLLLEYYTRADIARALGYKEHELQLQHGRGKCVTLKNALRVQAHYRRLTED